MVAALLIRCHVTQYVLWMLYLKNSPVQEGGQSSYGDAANSIQERLKDKGET